MTEFIEIGRTDSTWSAVRNMREYAERVGGRLAEDVATVHESYNNTYYLMGEWHRLEWFFHKNAPAGYRFVTHEDDPTRFGYERVHLSH